MRAGDWLPHWPGTSGGQCQSGPGRESGVTPSFSQLQNRFRHDLWSCHYNVVNIQSDWRHGDHVTLKYSVCWGWYLWAPRVCHAMLHQGWARPRSFILAVTQHTTQHRAHSDQSHHLTANIIHKVTMDMRVEIMIEGEMLSDKCLWVFTFNFESCFDNLKCIWLLNETS